MRSGIVRLKSHFGCPSKIDLVVPLEMRIWNHARLEVMQVQLLQQFPSSSHMLLSWLRVGLWSEEGGVCFWRSNVISKRQVNEIHAGG